MPQHDTYASNLSAALEFEDYVADALYGLGLSIGLYRSRSYQQAQGESRAGVEVKLDRCFRDTGNLFIETAETHHNSSPMKNAGIYGKGWLMVIGDFQRFWAIPFTTLRILQQFYSLPNRANSQNTGVGFLLDVKLADRHAAFIVTPTRNEHPPTHQMTFGFDDSSELIPGGANGPETA